MKESNSDVSIIPSHNSLNFAERTGRLVLITTVLGILGVGYSKVLIFAINTFSDKIYKPYIISHEHIIVACMLSTAFIILGHTIWYCYCEFSALNYTNRDDKEIAATRIINRADMAYSSIFKASPLYLTLSIMTFLLVTYILGIIVRNILIICIPIIPLLTLMFFFSFKNFSREVKKGFILLKKYIVSNWGNLVLWGILTGFMLVYLIIAMSVSQKSVFTAKFQNESSLPIKLNFENTIPEKVTIKFYSVDVGDKDELIKEVDITKSEFKRSFIEVTEKPSTSDKKSFVTLLDNEMKKGKEAYISKKSHYNFSYGINARDNLKQGKNFIVIQFNIGSLDNKEYYKIVNQIDLDEKGVALINKDQFQEKLKW